MPLDRLRFFSTKCFDCAIMVKDTVVIIEANKFTACNLYRRIMIRAYVNYPVSRICVHHNPDCTYFQRPDISNVRFIRINSDTISEELRAFSKRNYRFTSRAGLNDMWIEIDFSDFEFEISVLKYLERILSRFYMPFRHTDFSIHCQ